MFLFAIIFAYLIGSIPNAVWIGKVFYNIDVRNQGSRNAGATNTIRVLGLLPGLIVLTLDLLKGLLPLALMPIFFEQTTEDAYYYKEIMVAIVTVIGHVFPVYVGFRGGKGVATLVGVLIMLYPQVFPLVLAVFVVVFLLFRYISLSSMCAGLSLPIFQYVCFGTEKLPLLIFAVFIALLLPLTHRKNILRLMKKEEPKFRFRKNH